MFLMRKEAIKFLFFVLFFEPLGFNLNDHVCFVQAFGLFVNRNHAFIYKEKKN